MPIGHPPDPIFEAADRLAIRRRVSRSELYAEALAQLIAAVVISSNLDLAGALGDAG